jgi:outer membrane protein assembly factor BamB
LVPIGAPVIGKGTVYFGSGRGAFDTGKAHLFGVDAGSGNQELKVTLERQVYAPALDSGTAYVPTREKVYAVTLASGNTAWSSGVPEQATDVTLVEDLVVVRVFKQNQGGNSELYALSTGSGQQQWKYAPGEPLSAPTVVNGTIYVGAGKATVTAINADSGDEQWSTSVAEVSESPDPLQPAIEGDQAVFPFVTGATEGMFVGVNLGSRSKAWSKSADSRPKGAALLNGQAFCTFGSGLGSGTNAYDAVSGSQNWSWTFDGPVYSPTVGDDALYVGCGAASGDGKKVVAIDTGSGQNLWSLGTAGSPTELTYADSRLYGKISNEEYYVAISV